MIKIKNLIIIGVILFSFSNCTSLDDKVKEYRSINNKMAELYSEISAGTKNEEVAIQEITELQMELFTFDKEVSDQYSREERIKQKIKEKKKEDEKLAKRAAEKSRIDSIKQSRINKKKAYEQKKIDAKIAREEENKIKAEKLRAKREVAEMIKLEEQAERNAYLAELKEKGIFLVNFNNETYEINQKEWKEWKVSENYNSSEEITKMQGIVRAMGSAKANGLANSMYRTLSKGIAREGITLKAIQGIQIYEVITKGKSSFN